MKKAIITGVTGQDGSYLAELLLEKGYEVHGIRRWDSTNSNLKNIQHLLDKEHFHLHYGDLADFNSLSRLVGSTRPDEFYNLAALSHVRTSFDMPIYTGSVTGIGAAICLEAVHQRAPECHFYQASSSEMFGSSPPPQNENTPFHPRSPYGCAKAYAYHMAVNYRESYGMHVSNGILFNHESPRRGIDFVTRKITIGLNRIKHAISRGENWQRIKLGNLSACRDWGHARDYVNAMWMMLQHPTGGDYVVATGEMRSVEDFLAEAFWFSKLPGTFNEYIEHDASLFRPAEVKALQGDWTKIHEKLGWSPECTFRQLVSEMMEADRVT